jgi:hypothetical protein
MLIVQSRVESPQLAEARARVCSPLGRARNYLVSRVPWLMTSPWQSAPAPTTTALCAASAMSPVFPLPTCYFRFLSTIYSANQWRLPHKHDRREKMTLFAKWAKLWIRTPAKVAT